MRLFFAIHLPDATQAALDGVQRDVPGARWVSPANRHLTLRFLGEVSDEVRARVVSALVLEGETPFSLRVCGLDTFGGRRPRVLFANVAPLEPVNALAETIERVCVAAGLEPETRPFRAHVTVARLKRAERGPLRRLLEDHHALEVAPFAVTEVALVSSTLTSRGPVYERVARWPLGEPAQPRRRET